jgi:ABC-type Na+ transport system ATPase subunit NatA
VPGIHGVSFRGRQGEVFGLLGPNAFRRVHAEGDASVIARVLDALSGVAS